MTGNSLITLILSEFARRVIKREELCSALESFMAATGPAMLEVITDRVEVLYPIVPAGKGYYDMVLGPYIHEFRSESGDVSLIGKETIPQQAKHEPFDTITGSR